MIWNLNEFWISRQFYPSNSRQFYPRLSVIIFNVISKSTWLLSHITSTLASPLTDGHAQLKIWKKPTVVSYGCLRGILFATSLRTSVLWDIKLSSSNYQIIIAAILSRTRHFIKFLTQLLSDNNLILIAKTFLSFSTPKKMKLRGKSHQKFTLSLPQQLNTPSLSISSTTFLK